MMMLRADSRIFVLSFVILAGQAALLSERIAADETRTADRPALRAGASAIDVSPRSFPFGNRTVRANMHPGHLNPDAISPSGPVDPALTVLSVQTAEGRPVPVLANYSQHYFGSPPVSSDHFGKFAAALARRIGALRESPPFVGIMSQGTSGDQMWMDYGRPKNDPGIDRYAEEQFVHRDHW